MKRKNEKKANPWIILEGVTVSHSSKPDRSPFNRFPSSDESFFIVIVNGLLEDALCSYKVRLSYLLMYVVRHQQL